MPFSKVINLPLALGNAGALALMLGTNNTGLGVTSLCIFFYNKKKNYIITIKKKVFATGSSFALGWNITNTMGSADMPVAITILNSYSGWYYLFFIYN